MKYYKKIPSILLFSMIHLFFTFCSSGIKKRRITDKEIKEIIKQLSPYNIPSQKLEEIKTWCKQTNYNLEELQYDINSKSSEIKQTLFSEVNMSKYFDSFKEVINKVCPPIKITDFKFNVTRAQVNRSKVLIETVCPTIIKKLNDQYNSKIASIKVKYIGMSKAVDLVNLFPFLTNLRDTYSKERIENHLKHLKDSGISSKKYFIENDRLNLCVPSNWWLNDAYCKYIQSRNIIRASVIVEVLQEYTKLTLPQLDLDPKWLIDDRLNDFVSYTLAVSSMVSDFSKTNNFPFQLDLWIIPKEVKSPAFNIEDFHQMDNIELEDAKDEFFNNREINPSYYNLIKSPNESLKNIELNLKNSDYIENKDYWIIYGQSPYANVIERKVKDLILTENQYLVTVGYIRKIEGNNSTLANECIDIIFKYVLDIDMKHKRYILIVDRRNNNNANNKELSKTKLDKIFLIKQKRNNSYNIIPNEYSLVPEVFDNNLLEFLLPNVNKNEENIGNSKDQNGYKFLISFQASGRYRIKVYWYTDHGCVIHCPNHMEKLWPRYFVKDKDEDQELTIRNINKFQLCNINKKLVDYRFLNFLQSKYEYERDLDQ